MLTDAPPWPILQQVGGLPRTSMGENLHIADGTRCQYELNFSKIDERIWALSGMQSIHYMTLWGDENQRAETVLRVLVLL